ncbi:uncharacterized protein KZ484_009876 [Pholidichthys leucotaenia]
MGEPWRNRPETCAISSSIMDTFFRRHFRRKESALQVDVHANRCQQRRPSVAVPTSKARRRSSVGLPSSALTQHRRSMVHVGPLCAGGGCLGKMPAQARLGQVRRRSSTTTPGLNPRFAVRRRKVGKLRTIDTHLLGPSMLLASLIQMAEEEEQENGMGAGIPAREQQVEVRDGDNNGRMFSPSSSFFSGGDDSSSSYSTTSDGQSETGQLSEVDQLAEEEVEHDSSWSPEPHLTQTSTPSFYSSMGVRRRKASQLPSTPRPLIRPPRCLRRNSSQVFGGDSAPYFCHRSSVQTKRRRISTISKAGSPWPGRGSSLPNRKTSVYYLNHPGFCKGPRALSLLGAHGYDSNLESFSAFLLYVVWL